MKPGKLPPSLFGEGVLSECVGGGFSGLRNLLSDAWPCDPSDFDDEDQESSSGVSHGSGPRFGSGLLSIVPGRFFGMD